MTFCKLTYLYIEFLTSLTPFYLNDFQSIPFKNKFTNLTHKNQESQTRFYYVDHFGKLFDFQVTAGFTSPKAYNSVKNSYILDFWHACLHCIRSVLLVICTFCHSASVIWALFRFISLLIRRDPNPLTC